MYDGLLLDYDGVIVTPGDASALSRAARDALRDAGVEDADSGTVETLSIGVSGADLQAVSRRYDLDPDRLWRYRDDHVRDVLLTQVRREEKTPYPDVDTLATVDRPLGIVSNNQTRVIESALDRHDLAHRFDTIRARAPRRESLDRKKPRPTFLTEAMDDLAVENPLYVGDSPSDVEAGRRAGVDTAFLRRPHTDGTSLDTPPTYEVEGLGAVVEILNG